MEELSIYNFAILYRKGSKNAKADALSRREDYISKTVKRPKAILRQGKNGLKYNYEILATILVVENKELIKRIKGTYITDELS
jgi:hypothetical protein